MAATDYDSYVRAEWDLFIEDPSRFRSSLEAVAGITVDRVLDIGCGAGQELLPFVSTSATLGVGIDISPEVGLAGRELFARHELQTRVVFARSSAERLPFRTHTFDVVVCRLMLPYTNNEEALAEMARVLRPRGALFLKIHHARYYVRKLWSGLLHSQFLSAAHASRVLVNGIIYNISRRQPCAANEKFSETFQTRWLLRKELARQKLSIRHELPDSNPATPSFLVIKES